MSRSRRLTDVAVPTRLAITDGDLGLERAGSPEFRSWLRALERHDVALQLREKRLNDRELLDLAVGLRADFGGILLINGRPDVAIAAQAQGAHCTSSSAPLGRIRERFGERLLLGVSTHSVEEVRRAAEAGFDYVIFGPVFATPSKAVFGPPPGLGQLAEATRGPLPVIAIGGITVHNAKSALDAGAAGVAAIRGFASPADWAGSASSG